VSAFSFWVIHGFFLDKMLHLFILLQLIIKLLNYNKMSNTEYQKGSSSFLLKVILAIVIFVVLVDYVVRRNGDALLPF
jgi:hypothetical protein